MKILFFIESLRPGGKERRLVELLKGLKQFTYIKAELVLTRKEIHYIDVLDLDIKIHIIERKFIKKDPRLFFKFYKIARTFKPDVIHVWGNMVAIYALLTKLFLKIYMVNSQITGAPAKPIKGLLGPGLSFHFSDIIISNSMAGLYSYTPPPEKSRVIYNGFDFKRIEKLENLQIVRKHFKLSSKYIVCMVASFTELKDYETYIKAANMVLSKIKDVTFLCVGDGNYSDFKKLVDPENKRNIKFLGKQEKVESIMNVCDIGVLATYTEGISNSIMEFMALGKPVIATDGGGTKELIRDEESGFLIPQKSPEILAEKIKSLLNDETKRYNFGRNGKNRIIEEFSIDKMIESFVRVFKDISILKN